MQQQGHSRHTGHQHQDAGIDRDEFRDGAERQRQRQTEDVTTAEHPANRREHRAQQITPPVVTTGIRRRKKLRGGRNERMQHAEQRQAGL